MTFPEVFAENSSEESYKCKINILKDSPNTSISILIKSSTKSPQGTRVGVHYDVYQMGVSKDFTWFLLKVKLAESCHHMCLYHLWEIFVGINWTFNAYRGCLVSKGCIFKSFCNSFVLNGPLWHSLVEIGKSSVANAFKLCIYCYSEKFVDKMSALPWTFKSPFSHASTCSNTLKLAPVLKLTENLWAHELTSLFLHLLMSDFSGIWDCIRVVSELGLGPREIHGGDCNNEHVHFVPLNSKAFVLCSSCQIPVLCLRAERNTYLSQRHFQRSTQDMPQAPGSLRT